jgi:hypothetical protein
MESQQMMELVLAIQEEINTHTKIMLEEMKANQAKADAHHSKMEANMRSMLAELKCAIKDLKINGEETMACQEKTEVRLEEEPTSVEMKPEVAHEEVHREDAAVTSVRGLRKQRRGQKQAAGRCEEPKKLNRGIRGSWEKLAAACRKVFRHAAVAWRRINAFRKILTHGFCGLRKEVTAARVRITRCAGHGRKGRNKEIVTERNRVRRREPKNERSKGIRSRHVEELLHQRKRTKTAKSIGGRSRRLQPRQENYETGIAKRIARSPVVLQMIKKWTEWRGRPPPKRKKEQEAEEEPII